MALNAFLPKTVGYHTVEWSPWVQFPPRTPLSSTTATSTASSIAERDPGVSEVSGKPPERSSQFTSSFLRQEDKELTVLEPLITAMFPESNTLDVFMFIQLHKNTMLMSHLHFI
jgi:hypothetical protein